MKTIELMTALGSVKDSYITAAEDFRQGGGRKTVSLKRIWLIAAVIVLSVLLVGCAVAYVLSLTEMKIGQSTRVEREHYGPGWTVIEETEITYDILSVQSFSNSPNQQATREWHAYTDTYVDSVLDIPPEIREAIPETYSQYGCWTPEMVAYLDSLMEKCGLKLLDESLGTNQEYLSILTDSLHLSDLLCPQTYAQVEITSAAVHQHGSFHLGLNIILDESFDWPYYVMADLHYSTRGYFDEYTLWIRDLATVQEWEYSLPHGVTALLALDEETALILVEGKDGFFAMDFDAQMGVDRVTPEMMEKIAELFDFSMVPYTPTDEEWAETKALFQSAEIRDRAEYNAWFEAMQKEGQVESYDQWVRQTLEAGGDIASLGYAFYDIDGNGTQELLIGRDGYCEAVYWEQDGVVEQFSNAAENLYICKGGKIVYVLMPGEENFMFAQLENGTSRGLGSVQHTPGNPEGEYRASDPEIWGKYTYISEEEYWQTLDSFVRIPISFLPLTEYPLDEPVTVGSRVFYYGNRHSSYEEMIRIRLTDKQERWSRWSYDILDLDGDGQEEMIWREDERYFVYTMVDGEVCCYDLLSDGTMTICRDGIVQAVTHYGPENYTVRFWRLFGGKTELVDYLRYDTDADPENSWFRSPDLTGQDITLKPVSEAEAMSVIASYEPVEIDMKPIAEYPFS